MFQLYDDLFVAATGEAPQSFAPVPGSFGRAIRALGGRLKGGHSGDWAQNVSRATKALVAFYQSSGKDLLRGAGHLPGYKLVLGGKQNFGSSSLAAARNMLLCADTLLIPDPVSRWFESEHAAEGFAFPHMLEDLYFLLQLRPIVDARLPYPALVIFPSLEHVLEENDPVTQDRQELMALDFFSHYLGCTFEDLEEHREASQGQHLAWRARRLSSWERDRALGLWHHRGQLNGKPFGGLLEIEDWNNLCSVVV